MRVGLLSLLVIAVVLVGAGVARADVYKSKLGKVSIDIPKGWQVDAKDALIRAASANSEVAFVMWVVDSSDVKAALTKLEAELYSSISGLRWVDKPKKLVINKLKGTWVEGVGVSSRATQLDLIVFVAGPTSSKKGVILMAVVDHDKLETNRSGIQSIFGTLKAAK